MRRSAFTLIELLVVISIIALLIAVLVPSLAKAKQRASMMLYLNKQRQIGISCHTYGADWREFPSNLDPTNVFFNDDDDPGVPARLGVTASFRGHWVAALKKAGVLDQQGSDTFDHPDARCTAQAYRTTDRWSGRSGSDNTPRFAYTGPGTWRHDLIYYGHNTFTEYISNREKLIAPSIGMFDPLVSMKRWREARGVMVGCPSSGFVASAAWNFFEPHMGSPANPYPNAGAGWDPNADVFWTPRAHNFVFEDGHGMSEMK